MSFSKYAVVQNVICLCPERNVRDSTEQNVARLRIVLSALCYNNQLSLLTGDNAHEQCKQALPMLRYSTAISEFDLYKDRLHDVYIKTVNSAVHEDLLYVIEIF